MKSTRLVGSVHVTHPLSEGGVGSVFKVGAVVAAVKGGGSGLTPVTSPE